MQKMEYQFETTLRSCLGSFCFDDSVKQPKGKDTLTRIGLLFPHVSESSPKEILLLLKLISLAG